MNIYEESLLLHNDLKGKLEITNKTQITNKHDLSLVYTPGVAEACRKISENENLAYEYTMKNNCVAIISDGSAVLGLGNIGASASIPVMEGKAMLFKEYGKINAFPICLKTQDTNELIHIIKNLTPMFSGINLEDISAPRCFEIENALQEIGIPVFHDDQHGTAIVVQAAIINSAKLTNKQLSSLKVVINGAGAAGKAIADMLLGNGYSSHLCDPVNDVIICDRKGIISQDRKDIKNIPYKEELAKITNKNNITGTLETAMKNSDVFIGVSAGGVVSKEMVSSMNKKSIVFAMANPTPEIMPDLAKEAGAYIVGTGRSDFPNQVNNVLAFPGIFRGALDAKAKKITNEMKMAAAIALSECIQNLDIENIIPSPLDKTVAFNISKKVKSTYLNNIQ